MRYKSPLIPAIALAALVALTACTATVPPETGATSSPHVDLQNVLPDKNEDNWVMPLDQYMVTVTQQRQESYLHALYSQACLTKAGFAHDVPAPDTGVRSAGVGRSMFNLLGAQQNGYRVPDDGTGSSPWTQYVNRPLADDESTALDKCVRAVVADKDVPKWNRRDLTFASDLASAAVSGSYQDSEVLAKAKLWHDCMGPEGIDDLPSSPESMPSASMQARFGWDSVGTVDSGPTLTSDEIEVAVFDANCRTSSGYQNALYEAEWHRQVQLVEDNIDALTAVRSDIEKTDAAIVSQIAKAS